MAECPAALAQGRVGVHLRLRGAGDKAAKDYSADEESPANDNAPTGIIEPAVPVDSAAYRRGVRAVNQGEMGRGDHRPDRSDPTGSQVGGGI